LIVVRRTKIPQPGSWQNPYCSLGVGGAQPPPHRDPPETRRLVL